MMTPSASLEADDAQYEPTVSPSAFQAALAAGILAAQHQPPVTASMAAMQANPVRLVLTPLRNAHVEVALTCSDMVNLPQPDFAIQHEVSAAAIPDASAESAVSQPEIASSPSAAAQQAAEITTLSTDDSCDTVIGLPALSAAAVPAPTAEINSQQVEPAVPSGLQDDQALSAVSEASSSVSAQDPQAVLEQVAAESPRVHVSNTTELEAPAISKPEVVDNKPDVSAQEPSTSSKSDQTSMTPSTKAGRQIHQAAVHRSSLPSCSKRHAEVNHVTVVVMTGC